VTTSAERSKRIEALTPRQALDTVQYMSAWLDEQRAEPLDFTAEQQVAILNDIFQKAGHAPLPLSPVAKPDEQAAGQAARQLLVVLSKSDDSDLLAELDHWLAKPPEAETKALVELVVVPIVLTGCIMALGTRYKLGLKHGQTSAEIERAALEGKDLKDIVLGVIGLLKNLIGLG
jgi:hypothetical protein